MNPHGILKRLYGSSVGYDIKDPGNAGTVNVDRQLGMVKLVSAAAETRTLPAPQFAGAILTLAMKTDGGDITLTVTGGFDEAANTTITFSATGQFVTLMSVEEGSNKRWRVVGYDGVTGPTVALGTILTNTINEATSASGVTIDSVLLKDNGVTATNLTYEASTTTAEAAEHGAGAIGTAVAPVTYRWTDKGVIITQVKFDLTGLASVATANDVIGLAAGGAAYIGRNVVATNGVIFKTTLSCLETPATGDNDVNVVANSSGSLAYDGAGGTTYLANAGDLLAGQTIELLTPALTANDYYYLTAGTGDTAGTYTAGMYVLTTYGHALLA